MFQIRYRYCIFTVKILSVIKLKSSEKYMLKTWRLMGADIKYPACRRIVWVCLTILWGSRLTRSLLMTSYAAMQVGTVNCIWLAWDPFLKLINCTGSCGANHFSLVVGFKAIYFRLQLNKVLMNSSLS